MGRPDRLVSLLAGKIARLRAREDFRAGPTRALFRRMLWRLHWVLTRRPWRVMTAAGFPLWIAKTGSGALVYYQGISEPETASFLSRYLRQGMVVADAGAHFGEFTVLAALLVGCGGEVHAFEPHEELYGLLERNVAALGLSQVRLNRCALSDADGEAVFWERAEPASSSLAWGSAGEGDVSRIRKVRTRTLDSYFAAASRLPDLIKADVEGAERRVLLGARGLCSLPAERAPVWLLEYSVTACARLGEEAPALTEQLEDFGYRCYRLDRDGSLMPWSPPGPPHFPTVNLVAAKRSLA
ncbi:MAG: FkbM family methyltransferase [Bryobacterales bacterium]|nr:FkbM family methyltransferase [Bryobacteraceae bacterium]MDW8130392.1 FkbM family methyltransferase [Bryobacterales bacterium]